MDLPWLFWLILGWLPGVLSSMVWMYKAMKE